MKSDNEKKQATFFDQEAGYFLEKQEEASFHARRVMEKFLSIVHQYPHESILEIGCGIGTYSIPLLREGSSVTGIDISEKSLEVYKQFAEREKLHGRLKLVVQKAEEIDSIGTYDMVICRHVLHHVDDVDEVARRIYRSLKKGGVGIFLEPNPQCLYWYPYLTFHPHRSWKVEKGVLKCFPWMLQTKFRNAGFHATEVLHYGLFPPFVINRFQKLLPLEEIAPRIPFVNPFLALTILKVFK
jgi:2-polyprenyl-3-methyl-5-hydroxy-6-metoxy-1,4-benzoquinol methylase